MFGKGALIIVFAFVAAITGYQAKLNRTVVATHDNFNKHYLKRLTHEGSLSAMNYGINDVWANNTTNANFTISTEYCSSMVTIAPAGTDTVKLTVKSKSKIYDEDKNKGNLLQIEDSVIAVFANSMPLSKYFWYTDDEKGVFWITGDTVWGPMHTNKTLKTKGSPVFYGKVTAFQGISPAPWRWKNQAKFYGGWEVGVEVDMPTDMTPLLTAANTGNGGAPINTKTMYDKETAFDFQSDGSVIRTVYGDPPDTVMVADIAPTGVLYSTADVHVMGDFNGQLTVYSDNEIWIDDDLVYVDDPLTNPNSDDVLGLVAKNFINVTDNVANNNDVNIQAAILALTGSFRAENYNTRPVGGVLNLTGSVAQYHRGPVGTFYGSGTIASGFSKRYRYDGRFNVMSPPKFPTIQNSLRLVDWWE
jgi:hypothetical protein